MGVMRLLELPVHVAVGVAVAASVVVAVTAHVAVHVAVDVLQQVMLPLLVLGGVVLRVMVHEGDRVPRQLNEKVIEEEGVTWQVWVRLRVHGRVSV